MMGMSCFAAAGGHGEGVSPPPYRSIKKESAPVKHVVFDFNKLFLF